MQAAFELFATPKARASWTDEPGMVQLGVWSLPAAAGDGVRAEMSFGRTEISVVAINGRTGERRPIAIDYDFRAT